MKGQPCKIVPGVGFVPCESHEATYLHIHMPDILGDLHLPVMIGGTREGTGNWTWNGDTEKVTLKPSIKRTTIIGANTCHDDGGPSRQCISHVWVNDGMVIYHDDTTHELRGQTLPLLDLEEESCQWTYHNSHEYWSTSCGQSFDADDFGCKEITTCPSCGKQAIL